MLIPGEGVGSLRFGDGDLYSKSLRNLVWRRLARIHAAEFGPLINDHDLEGCDRRE